MLAQFVFPGYAHQRVLRMSRDVCGRLSHLILRHELKMDFVFFFSHDICTSVGKQAMYSCHEVN